MKKRDWILYSIAVFLSLTLFFIIIHFLQLRNYIALLWICYISLALIIVGIIKRNSDLILSQIIILLIPDIIWTIYFIITLVDRSKSIVIPAQFFDVSTFLYGFLSLLHIYTMIFALIALAIVKIEKNYKALKISFIEITIIFILMSLIPGNDGVNCLPTPVNCSFMPFPEFIPYPLFLFFSVSVFIIISYFVIISIPKFRKNINTRKNKFIL